MAPSNKAKNATEDLREHCQAALLAFSLADGQDNQKDGASLAVLKDDEDSLVVQVNNSAVLKQRRSRSSLVSLKATAELEALLSDKEHGSLCPRRLPVNNTTSGGTSSRYLFCTADQSLWSASAFVPNQPVFDWLDQPRQWTSSQTRAAGALLYQLHKVGQQVLSLVPDLPQIAPLETLPQQIADALAKHRAFIDSFYPECNPVHTVKKLTAVLAKISVQQAKDYRSDPLTLVHGDFHPGNVLFDQEKALCVIDLDYAHQGPALFDVAYGQITFGETNAQAFIEGYFDSRDEDRSEAAAALASYKPVAAAWILLWCLGNLDSKAFEGRLSSTVRQALDVILDSKT